MRPVTQIIPRTGSDAFIKPNLLAELFLGGFQGEYVLRQTGGSGVYAGSVGGGLVLERVAFHCDVETVNDADHALPVDARLEARLRSGMPCRETYCDARNKTTRWFFPTEGNTCRVYGDVCARDSVVERPQPIKVALELGPGIEGINYRRGRQYAALSADEESY
jgi:hypothetical protein